MAINEAELRPKSELYEVGGHGLHITEGMLNEWAVWLNTNDGEYDGLCIGAGSTRDSAVSDAVQSLKSVIEQLQKPAADDK